MRHYEIVLLVHPSRSEQVPAMLHRYKDMVRAAKGRVHRVEDWGRRRLAYMISEVHKAHYVMMNVECELDTLRELERNFKFNDSVVRSMVIRRTRAETGQSAMAKAKAEEDRLEAEKAARAEREAAAGDEDAPSAKMPSENAAESSAETSVETAAAKSPAETEASTEKSSAETSASAGDGDDDETQPEQPEKS